MCFMSDVASRRRRRILLRVRAAVPLVKRGRDAAGSLQAAAPRSTAWSAHGEEEEQNEQERKQREEPEAESPRSRPDGDDRHTGAWSGDGPAALGDAVSDAKVVRVDADGGDHRHQQQSYQPAKCESITHDGPLPESLPRINALKECRNCS